MGQLLSSTKHGDPLDPGLLTNTAPTGFYQEVLSEQPGNDVEMPQSDPSSTLLRSSATTHRLAPKRLRSRYQPRGLGIQCFRAFLHLNGDLGWGRDALFDMRMSP